MIPSKLASSISADMLGHQGQATAPHRSNFGAKFVEHDFIKNVWTFVELHQRDSNPQLLFQSNSPTGL